MSTLPLSNTAEGQASGTTLSTANSGGGSGDAFDSVTVGAASVFAFSNAQAQKGSNSYLITQPASVVVDSAGWTFTGVATVYARVYVYLLASPTTAMRLYRTYLAGNVNCGMSINTSRFLQIFAGVGGNTSAASASSVAIPLNTWVRIESRITHSITTSNLDLAWYLGDDITGAGGDVCSTTTRTNGATADEIRFGSVAGGIASNSFYMDDLAANSTGYVGPSAAPPAAVIPYLVMAPPIPT